MFCLLFGGSKNTTQFNLHVKFQSHDGSRIQISWQVTGSKEKLCYGFTISKCLVWPVKIKRARYKSIKGIFTHCAIFGRASKNFDFAVTGLHKHSSTCFMTQIIVYLSSNLNYLSQVAHAKIYVLVRKLKFDDEWSNICIFNVLWKALASLSRSIAQRNFYRNLWIILLRLNRHKLNPLKGSWFARSEN